MPTLLMILYCLGIRHSVEATAVIKRYLSEHGKPIGAKNAVIAGKRYCGWLPTGDE